MPVPLKNLQENYLLNKLPPGIIAQDPKGLIQAVVNAFQDNYEDLRSAATDLANLWSPTGAVGFPRTVILYTYHGPGGQNISIEQDLQPDTPTTDDATLLAWSAAQANVDPSLSVSAFHTTSTNRTALIQTAQFLADTLGVQIVPPIEATTDPNLYLQRVLQGYFNRLKLKGTGQSFEIAGRVIGFSDTMFVPLWGRLSPRYPSEPGNLVNKFDFNAQPEIFPVEAIPDPIYDPTVTNDGPLYTWTSIPVSLDPSSIYYAPTSINTFSPFISVTLTDETQTLPAAGQYLLTGGGSLTKANVQINSSLLVTALAPGAAFNNMQVTVSLATPTTFILSVTYNLSAIKFKTSLFDLTGGLDIDYYGAAYVQTATPNSDLVANPALYGNPSGTPYFVNSGYAVAPFRAWKAGAVPAPLVTTWPTVSTIAQVGTIIPRVEATSKDQELNDTVIIAAAQNMLQAMETVRPAIDDVRTLATGFVIEDTVGYAAYQNTQILATPASPLTMDTDVYSMDSDMITMDATITPSGIIVGTLPNDGISYPIAEFDAEFYYVLTDGTSLELGQSFDLAHPGNVILILDDPRVTITGNYNFNTQSFRFNVTGQSGILKAVWTTTGQDVIRDNPPLTDYGVVSTQPGPEDDLDLSRWYSLADDVPICKPIIGDGTDEGHNYYDDTGDLEVIQGDRWMTAFDESGQEQQLVVLEQDKGIIPRVKLYPIEVNTKSQKCIGVRQISGWSCDETFILNEEDTGHTADSSGLTSLIYYHVGLLRNSLVADQPAHWLPNAQQDGLVNWIPLRDHPNGPWPLASTEYPITNVQGSYTLASRIWTTDRGWALQLQEQAASFNMTHDFQLGGTVAFWCNPGAGAPLIPFTCDTTVVLGSSTIAVNSTDIVNSGGTPVGGPGINIMRFGPLQVWLNGLTASAYIVDPNGNANQVGMVMLKPYQFNFIVLSGTDISTNEDTPLCDAAATTSITPIGTQIVDGVNLLVGMTCLLTAQENPGQNGHYVVEQGTWSRVPYDWPRYDYVRVTGGTQAGIWQIVSPNTVNAHEITFDSLEVSMDATININVDTSFTGGPVYWRLVNTSWAFGVGTLQVPVAYDNRQFPTALQGNFNLPTDTVYLKAGIQSIVLNDLRFWTVPKTDAQIEVIRQPQLTYSYVNWPIWSMRGSRGSERYPVQVLTSGYAFPSLNDSLCRFDIDQWVFRYGGLGDFVGPEWRRFESYGDGRGLLSSAPVLADNTADLRLGNFGVASSDGSTGVDQEWDLEAPGNILTLYNTNDGVARPDFYLQVPAVPWPPKIAEYTDPLETIWVEGTDGNVYAVYVDDGPMAATLLAKYLPRLRNTAEVAAIQPPNANLDVIDVPSAVTALGGDGQHSLVVSPNSGAPLVTTQVDTTIRSDVHLYSFGQRLQTLVLNDPTVALNPNIWTNINTFGEALGAAALNKAGTMTFDFNGTLVPGKYNLQLQLGNAGILDSTFTGYIFEIGVDTENPISTVTLMPNGPGYITVSWLGSSTTLLRPDIDAADLAVALNDLASIAAVGGVTVAGNLGGPWNITWNNDGIRAALTVVAQGTAASILTIATGSVTSQAVQQLIVNRTVFTVPLQVLNPTDAVWTLTINWTNALALPQYNQLRAPVIMHLDLYNIAPKLWRVNTTPLALVQVPLPNDYDATVAGSWKRNVYADGAVTSTHELEVLAVSNYGDTDLPERPAGGLLTGSSQDKNNYIAVLGNPVPQPNTVEDLSGIFNGLTADATLQV